MRSGTRFVAALLLTGAVVAGAPAQACSVPESVSIDDLLGALDGTLPPDHEWAYLGEVTGVAEYEVVATWGATGDFTAASASIPTRVWGETPLVAQPVIRGGEYTGSGPTTTVSSCPPSIAWELGRRNYEGWSGTRNPQPVVEDSLTDAQQAQLTAIFGEPRDVAPLAIEDAHPTASQPGSTLALIAICFGLVAAIAAIVLVARRRRV